MITEEKIQAWLDKIERQDNAIFNTPIAIIEQLLNEEITLDELRVWIND